MGFLAFQYIQVSGTCLMMEPAAQGIYLIGSHVYADCHMLARADVNAHLDVPARFGPGSSTRCSLWSGWLSPILECSGASRLRVLGSRVSGFKIFSSIRLGLENLKVAAQRS